VLLTRTPLYSPGCPGFLVRLACVKRAASVDSEPGSNSRLISSSYQSPQLNSDLRGSKVRPTRFSKIFAACPGSRRKPDLAARPQKTVQTALRHALSFGAETLAVENYDKPLRAFGRLTASRRSICVRLFPVAVYQSYHPTLHSASACLLFFGLGCQIVRRLPQISLTNSNPIRNFMPPRGFGRTVCPPAISRRLHKRNKFVTGMQHGCAKNL
jgi:hypothetical protein